MSNTRELVQVKSLIGKPSKQVTQEIFNGWKPVWYKGRKYSNKGYQVVGKVTDTHLDDEARKEKEAALNPAIAKENARLKAEVEELKKAAKKDTKVEEKKAAEKVAKGKAKAKKDAAKETEIPK